MILPLPVNNYTADIIWEHVKTVLKMTHMEMKHGVALMEKFRGNK